MQVLVVDDDPLAAEMIAFVLEDQGYQVYQAENAVAALELLNEQPAIELVVSDMNMPLVSGVELYRELKSQGRNLPFILLTGDDPEAARAEEPAIDACLMKDFSMEETLPAAIAKVMAANR
ncbi:response regulator [Marinospirillum insulare]|uniref:Response regulator n=1 Tax=Marinospirillum insulare TaxID=217169 RepID=A0ABQ5ZYB9_9GAMM|nr:response regulator [Marinospirillum insulare]GLR65184.1 response regulator [Marinospirillum insulare]